MTNLLVKLFVKNSANTTDPQVRENYGKMSGIVGIIANILLSAAKFITALFSGFAISILADALNNLFDAVGSAVTFLGFKLAAKEQDTEHPYGHGRIEYISGFALSFIIIFVGIQLLTESVGGIFSPSETGYGLLSAVVMIISVLVKIWLWAFNKKLSKRINSSALKTFAVDSLCDCLATFAILISIGAGLIFGVNISGYAGAFVAGFIIYTGIRAAKETLSPLLGAAPDPEFVKRVEKTVMSHSGIIGVHDLVIHDYGVSRKMISLHAEVDAKNDIIAAHDLIDLIEVQLREEYNCICTIHIDPVLTSCEQTNAYKNTVEEILCEIDKQLTFHDFRIVSAQTHSKLIFDVVVPYKFRLSDDILRQTITEKVENRLENCFCVIEIDKK